MDSEVCNTKCSELAILEENYELLCSVLSSIIDPVMKYMLLEKYFTIEEEKHILLINEASKIMQLLLQKVSTLLKADDKRAFYVLLKIMKEHGDKGTQSLADQIRKKLKGIPSNLLQIVEDSMRSIQLKGNERPQLKDIENFVVTKIAANWKHLGRNLEIDDNLLKIIEKNNPHDCESCCSKMMSEWLDLNPNASWKMLNYAMDKTQLELNEVPDKVEKLNNVADTFPSSVEKTSTVSDKLPDTLEKLDSAVKTVQQLYKTVTKKLSNSVHTVDTNLTTYSVSDILHRFKETLKVRYRLPSDSDEPHYYIQLALLKQISIGRTDDEFTKQTLQGQLDEVLVKKEPIEEIKDVFCYKNTVCPRIIFIVGAPGIGKTTLAEEICKKWVEDDQFLSETYDYIVLIPLRWVQGRSLESIMIECTGGIETYHELKKSGGSKCLIILEGLDEVSIKWQQNDNFFIQLVVRKTVFESATILITSRHHACKDLYEEVKREARRIEIVGFSKKQIAKYIENKFCSSSAAFKFIKELEYFPHISSLCYIPLSLKMVAEIFFYNNDSFPTYLTELYNKFIVLNIKKYCQHEKSKSIGTIISDDKKVFEKLSVTLRKYHISDEAIKTVFLLSKLAYYSYFQWNESDGISKNPKIIYTSEDLSTCNMMINVENRGFGLLKIAHTSLFHDLTFNFNHLSIQEYLCALYISILPENEQSRLLKEYFIEYPNVWLFYAGITGLNSFTLSYFKEVLLQLNDDTMQQNNLTIAALNCIYEARHSDIHKNMCINQKFPINIHSINLLPYNCISISYFISFECVTHLNIAQCYIRDVGAKMIKEHSKSVSSLKVINLCDNRITSEGMQHILSIATDSLVHLLLAGNPLLDDGIIKIIPVVTKLSHIIELNIAGVHMTSSGAYALGDYLQGNNLLTFLNISNNTIGDKGIKAISDSLSLHTKSRLVYLNVSNCNFSCNGAIYIGNMLKLNANIKHLNISHNFIGDNGMIYIIEGILTLNKFTSLDAINCRLQDSIGSSLLDLLTLNSSLKTLDIRSNDFVTFDFVEKTLEAAINHTKLFSFEIDECRLDPMSLNLCAVIRNRKFEKGKGEINQEDKFNETEDDCLTVMVKPDNILDIYSTWKKVQSDFNKDTL